MLNLSTHGQSKQEDKVHQQDRPKDWNIQEGEEGAEETRQHGRNCIVPEFEFGQATDEGTEFVNHWAAGKIVWQLNCIVSVQEGVIVEARSVFSESRIEFGTQEEQENVEQINS